MSLTKRHVDELEHVCAACVLEMFAEYLAIAKENAQYDWNQFPALMGTLCEAQAGTLVIPKKLLPEAYEYARKRGQQLALSALERAKLI